MSNYHRCRIPGGSYFFTVVTAGRRPILLEHIAELRRAFQRVRKLHPYRTDAIVILPDHLHCIWTLPPRDADFSIRWRLIKTAFSTAPPLQVCRTMCRRSVWQKRFWEHALRDDRDFERHADYIHYNPVKHGYVARARDWEFSSFRRYVDMGIYDMAWATDDADDINVE
jgi:putative transposase